MITDMFIDELTILPQLTSLLTISITLQQLVRCFIKT